MHDEDSMPNTREFTTLEENEVLRLKHRDKVRRDPSRWIPGVVDDDAKSVIAEDGTVYRMKECDQDRFIGGERVMFAPNILRSARVKRVIDILRSEDFGKVVRRRE